MDSDTAKCVCQKKLKEESDLKQYGEEPDNETDPKNPSKWNYIKLYLVFSRCEHYNLYESKKKVSTSRNFKKIT